MSSQPEKPDYAEWRAQLWRTLRNRYPADPEFSLIEHLDLILGREEQPVIGNCETMSAEILLLIEEFFRATGNQPTYASALDSYLRARGISLPPPGRTSSAVIASMMANSPLFERVPVGISPQRTAKWRLVRDRLMLNYPGAESRATDGSALDSETAGETLAIAMAAE